MRRTTHLIRLKRRVQIHKEEDYKTRFKIKKYGNLRTHLPSSLDEALLNSIVENRPLKQTFICAPQQLSSVVKSFGKYRGLSVAYLQSFKKVVKLKINLFVLESVRDQLTECKNVKKEVWWDKS